MIGFFVGALLGGTVGVTTVCLCTAASRADRYLEGGGSDRPFDTDETNKKPAR
ncbi:MAG: DUF3789 domain-containing protein [Ruminococcus sp.]|nr:DUF3789 domain-containing protein [Ruminococcus sp.]